MPSYVVPNLRASSVASTLTWTMWAPASSDASMALKVAASTSARPPASRVLPGPDSCARPDSLAARCAASICARGDCSPSRDGTTVSSALTCARWYPGMVRSASLLCSVRHGGRAAAPRLRRSRRRVGLQADDVLGPDRNPCQRPAGRLAQARNDGRRRRDVGRLAHALEPVRGFGVRVLEQLYAHGRHVEDRRQQVVRERGVEHLAVVDLNLLEQRDAQPLGAAALDLALERLRVPLPADLLVGLEPVRTSETELGIA